MTQPKKIGITGGIGSGKTLFCKYLTEAGEKVLYADSIAKAIYHENENVKTRLISLFGSGAYTGDKLNNKLIAEEVFQNEKSLQKLNAIIHPEVIKKSEEMMNRAVEEFGRVFYEAALIYEANMESLFDLVILVTSPLNSRIARVVERDNVLPEEVELRIQKQLPQEEKIKRAGFIVNNDGDKNRLREYAQQVINMVSRKV